MRVFNIVLALGIIALLGNFYRLLKRNNLKITHIFENFKDDLSAGLFNPKNLAIKSKNIFNQARQLFYSVALVLLLFMAISGFLLPLFWQPTDGVLLFVHVLLAPFFVVSIVFAIVLFANKMQFNSGDYQYLSGPEKSAGQKWVFWKKVNFWLFCSAVVFNIGSILFAMYPLFGTTEQYWLINVHRYSALLLLVLTINHLTLKYTMKK